MTERLRAALLGLRPDELMTTAEHLREEVLTALAAAAAESDRPELVEAVELLADVPDTLEAAAALYAQARSGTEGYLQRHGHTGDPPARPNVAAPPIATPVSPPGTAPTVSPTATSPAPAQPDSTTPPPGERKPASFGWTTSTNYRKTFFDAHPETESLVVVHHAVEQQVLKHFPGVVAREEMHSLENLRGIPKGSTNNLVHLSAIRKAWNRFYKPFRDNNTVPSKQQLLDFATMIDDQYGTSFNPDIR
ncbi:hypothetical protein [Allokutzneria oryzae]|uniref:HNH endonuclease n=1 Tax=Allokutzneria oryzae TaxID=1378989 RepID=A0ABV5ZW01_9PSEU